MKRLRTAVHLACSGDQSNKGKVITACVNPKCAQQPFLCDNDHCLCSNFHKRHRTMPVKQLLRSINQPLKVNELVTCARSSMLECIDNAIAALQQLRLEHEQFVNTHAQEQLRWSQVREKLLAQDGEYPFTGDLLCKMLKELENADLQSELPYSMGEDQLEEKLKPEVTRLVEKLTKAIKDVWKLPQIEDPAELNLQRQDLLTTLIFKDRKVKLEDLNQLESKRIKTIVFEQCNCSKWQMIFRRIATAPEVQQLEIIDIPIPRKTLKEVSKIRQLTRLVLHNIELMEGMLKRLYPLRSLTTLTITGNPANNLMEQRSFLTLVKRLKLLQLLEFPFNKRELRLLNFYVSGSTYERIIRLLTTNVPNLRSLTLNQSWRSSDRSLVNMLSLIQLSKLIKLNIDRAKINPLSALLIGRLLPRLEDLTLSHCDVTDEVAKVISRNLRSLKRLNLLGHRLSKVGYGQIAQLAQLTYLDLQSRNIAVTDECIEALATGKSNLKHLLITASSPAVLPKLLSKNPLLQTLVIGARTIGLAVCQCIATLTELKTLHIGTVDITGISEEAALTIGKRLPLLKELKMAQLWSFVAGRDNRLTKLTKGTIQALRYMLPKGQIISG